MAHADGLNVHIWHGASRESNIKELTKYDVVRVLVASILPVLIIEIL
jgi:hypothetical protein